MELFTNILWLAVGAGLFLKFRPRTRQVQFALLLAVAILFPIISASDDVNSVSTFTEILALLTSLCLVIGALIAIAAIEAPQPSRRFVLVAIPSDPRSPPRR